MLWTSEIKNQDAMKRTLRLILIAAMLLPWFAWPKAVDAHANTFVYTDMDLPDDTELRVTLRVDYYTIHEIAPQLDEDQDGTIALQELRTGYAEHLQSYLDKGIRFSTSDTTLSLDSVNQDMPNPNVFKFQLVYISDKPITYLSTHYDLFFDVAPNHQNIMVIHKPDNTSFQHLFDINHKQWSSNLVATETGAWQAAKSYLLLGIEHILRGYDHLLFLFALLMVPISNRRIVGIVTSFTLAHSLTLAASALGIVSLPSRLVEPAIALSILYVVIENVFKPAWAKQRWILTFFFGLIHGFGFAGLIQEIGLPRNQELVSLLSFNIGVELGQLAIVAVMLPILHYIQQRKLYGKLRFSLLCAIGSAGCYWFIIRMLEL